MKPRASFHRVGVISGLGVSLGLLRGPYNYIAFFYTFLTAYSLIDVSYDKFVLFIIDAEKDNSVFPLIGLIKN